MLNEYDFNVKYYSESRGAPWPESASTVHSYFVKSVFFKNSTIFWKNHRIFLIDSTVYQEKFMIF